MNFFKSLLVICSILVLSASCNFNKSVSKDLMTGLSTKGDGLSADDVYVTVNDKKVTNNQFYYGENIYTIFENVKGFTIENGNYYPEMQVTVTSKKGDTLLFNPSLFGVDHEGFKENITELIGNVILARPIYSGEDYKLQYTLWDKKGEGVYYSDFKFDVLPDPTVKVTKNGLDFKEAYLMSLTRSALITDGKVLVNEDLLFDFQDISGYTLVDGEVALGLKITVIDALNNTILNMDDVFGDQKNTEQNIKRGVGAKLKLNKGKINNPITFKVYIWDKNSDTSFNAETKLVVE